MHALQVKAAAAALETPVKFDSQHAEGDLSKACQQKFFSLTHGLA
jgi:hypothetical protein